MHALLTDSQRAIIGTAYLQGLDDGLSDGVDSEVARADAEAAWVDHATDEEWRIVHPSPLALALAKSAYADGFASGWHATRTT